MATIDGMNSFHGGLKFRALAHHLRERISEGQWPVGSRLPTERELAHTHQVGVNTVRRAVNVLVDEQLVQRRQGSGTFVIGTPARSRPQQQRFVGVLVPSTSYFYPKVIDGIERVMSTAGARVLLSSSDYDVGLEMEQTRQLLAAQVSGLLLVPNLHVMDDPQGYVDQMRAFPVPYVLVERRPPRPEPDDPTAFVCSNHLAGGYTAVRHLVELGHERLGHLGRLLTGTSEPVAQAFTAAVAAFGLEDVPQAVQRREEWSTEEIAAYARMCKEEGITGVFCLGDRDAARLVKQARAIGLAIPRDLSIVAYDDETADVGEVPLTAISPPKSEVGALAAELLLRRMERGPQTAVPQVQLQPRLVVRASTGRALARAGR
ncbi:GntR family transcriptional regulator [Dactylosporangium sp. CA-233914]|uniref:GntR family transcriptional regulator n=1 Tax=Dactylosporangium sp. CA-233914 TaxID=3239934 RepID=UPI003D89B8D2